MRELGLAAWQFFVGTETTKASRAGSYLAVAHPLSWHRLVREQIFTRGTSARLFEYCLLVASNRMHVFRYLFSVSSPRPDLPSFHYKSLT
jgi:hypothetical protein